MNPNNDNHENDNARENDEARLTAYALGQLNPEERAAAEAILARVEQARQTVQETAALAAQVQQAYQQAPSPQPSPKLRDAIDKAVPPDIRIKAEPLSLNVQRRRSRAWLLSYTISAGILGVCLLLAATVFYSSTRQVQVACEVAQTSASVPVLGINASRRSPSYRLEDHGTLGGRASNGFGVQAAGQVVGEATTADGKKHPFVYSHGRMWDLGTGIPPRRYAKSAGYLEVQYPDTEQYSPITDNAFRSAERQPLSTFAIDVDTASYANVRRFLSEGRLPPPDAVRIEEMINYFPYEYAQPSGKAPFAVNMELAACPWQPEHRLLRVGLKGREVEREKRGPSNLVFLLDVSGSMDEPNKLPLVKQAMRLLVEQLTEDDRVAIVTYADGTNVPLPSARGDQKQRILDAIDSLQAGGSTYGSAGIELAYKQAAEHFLAKGVNRIILCTDGDLNVGVTKDDDLVRLIEAKAKSGVFLTVLGFGTGNLQDSKMEKLADHGHGVYAYIDGLREAHRVLVEQITGHLVTIAKDLKIQIEFNPAEVAEYRLIGYENRVMPSRDFDNDRKQGGDIGAGHTVTALYELVPVRDGNAASSDRPLKYQRVPDEKLTDAARRGEWLTLHLRYKEPEGEKSRLLDFTAKDSGEAFDRASPDFRFASAVAAFGMVLRHSPHRGNATLSAVEYFAGSSLGKDPNGHRAEFLDLVRKARSLTGEK